MIDVGLIAARFAHYAALIMAFGAFAYVGPANGGGFRLRRWLGALTLGANLLVPAAAGAVLTATVASLGGGYASLADASLWFTVLTETDFGWIWSVRLLFALALALVSWAWLRTRSPVWRKLGLVIGAALLASIA